MSATRDKTQKFTFVYSNLYQIYKNQQAAAPQAHGGLATAQVLKAHEPAAVRISDFRPAELMAKRINVVPKPAVLQERNEALDSLKANMRSLNDLHSRLKVMLKDLEDLVKE